MKRADLLELLFAPGSLSSRYQPIFDLSSGRPEAIGVEGLMRGPYGTNLEPAGVLFEYVRWKGQERRMDRFCLELFLSQAAQLPPHITLSLNVHASTLCGDAGFAGFLAALAERHGFEPERLMIEVLEHAPAWDQKSFRDGLVALKRLGVMVALDDVGVGYTSFGTILRTRPDFLKIDSLLIRGCDLDEGRRIVIETIRSMAERLESRVIAEGVETAEELQTVLDLRIPLIQGFYLSPTLDLRQAGQLLTEILRPPMRAATAPEARPETRLGNVLPLRGGC
jgi:EAL domain-containing protein (putative c-di-GMP-specific phosphodiesterase class I)